MLKYLWTGIICTPDFLKSLQRRLAFIDMNRDHSQSGISEWKKKKVYLLVSPCVNNVWTLLCEHPSVNCFFKCYCTLHVHVQSKFIYIYIYYNCHLHITMCHHMWTMCEQCVNIHLPIASLNPLYPVCTCTKQVYLHLHLLHCHLHVTMCHHMWTLCEHLCEHPSTNCFFKCYCTMHVQSKARLSTSTSTTLPLAYHHVSSYVNNVLTLLCEHPSTNCFFKCTVPCMCMYKASLSTSTSTTLPLAYHHVSPYVNTAVWTLVWTSIYQLFL